MALNLLFDTGVFDTDYFGMYSPTLPDDPQPSGGTVFYLRNIVATTPMPTEKQSADTIFYDQCEGPYNSDEYARYGAPSIMNTTKGTVGVNIAGIYVPPGAAHYNHIGTWISPPLNAQSISGTVSVVLGCQSAAANNSYVRVKIYKWKANNTFGSDILALTTSTTECNPNGTNSTQNFIIDAAITATSFEAGDKIVIEIETYNDNVLTDLTDSIILFNGADTEYLSYVSFSASVSISTPLLTIGNTNYPFLINTLNISNAIGERGIASFQIWDNNDVVTENVKGDFLGSGPNLLAENAAPVNGTCIVFKNYGNVPPEITVGDKYYVVSSGGHFFQIADSPNGTPLTWTDSEPSPCMWDEYKPYNFTIGETVIFYYDGNIIWSGVIERITKKLPALSGILYHIQCISWNYAMDKRRVVNVYNVINPTSTAYRTCTGGYSSELTCGGIVEDIIDTYLYTEGITAGSLSSGTVLNSAVFNYIKPSQILDTLSEQSGYIWQVNPDKTLDFKAHDSTTLSFNIGSTEIKRDSIQYIRGSPKYRNVQYVVGGYDLTDTLTEVQYGDSTKQTFVVPYPLMQTPEITTLGSTRTIGILGVDTTKEYFWNKFSNIISQNATDTPLSAAQTITIEYVGGFQSVARSDDNTAISLLQAYTGGSGIVEDAILKSKDSIYSDNVTLADNLISRYSTVCDTFRFRTLTDGITPGKILKIDLLEFGLSSEEFLVDSVTVRDQDGLYFWYDINCVSGYDNGGWSKFFDSFITRTIEKDIWEGAMAGDIISVAFTTNEGFTWTEDSTQAVFTCPLPCADTSTDTWNIYPNVANEVRVSTGVAGYPC